MQLTPISFLSASMGFYAFSMLACGRHELFNPSLTLSKSCRTFDSDSPNHIESSSGPFTEMKLDLTSLAMAFATSVLPQPDGPYNSIPFEGCIPYRWNLDAYLAIGAVFK